MKRPEISVALRIYYEHPEIGNKEISELFSTKSSTTLVRLKVPVKEKMVADGIKSWGLNTVNTKVAYEVWGLDVDDLEHRAKKLKKLGFLES